MFSWRRDAVVLVSALGAAVVLLSGCGTASPQSPHSTSPFALLRRHFAIFSRARQVADRLPMGLVPHAAVSSLGLDPGHSRMARAFKSIPIFLLPGARSTCVVSRSQAIGGCWPTSLVVKGFATTTTICGTGVDERHVVSVGVVPDGVSAVTVARSDGRDSTVPVLGNVFVARTSAKPPLPLWIIWMVQGERVVQPTGLSQRVAEHGCSAFRPPRAPAP
jgi:hypothetical protein